jgi:hypothetical protein
MKECGLWSLLFGSAAGNSIADLRFQISELKAKDLTIFLYD